MNEVNGQNLAQNREAELPKAIKLAVAETLATASDLGTAHAAMLSSPAYAAGGERR
jgi:hypothetical protein